MNAEKRRARARRVKKAKAIREAHGLQKPGREPKKTPALKFRDLLLSLREPQVKVEPTRAVEGQRFADAAAKRERRAARRRGLILAKKARERQRLRRAIERRAGMIYWFEFYRDRRGRHRARIRHRNGRVILVTSEGDGYARRADCQRALCRVLDAPKEAFRVAPMKKEKRR